MQKKRTKIVATLSDKRCDPEFIRELYEEGMDVIRINSAHCSAEFVPEIVRNARQVSDKIAILVDTKGPEIRTTICDEPIQLIKGTMVDIVGDPERKSTASTIFVTYPLFAAACSGWILNSFRRR